MPITFQPAEPVAPQVSSAYGAAEQFDKTLPTLMGAYEHAASLQAQVAQHNAALSAQVGEANARNVTGAGIAEGQRQEHEADRAERRQQLAASMLPSARDLFHAQAAQDAMAKHAQVQAWLQGQKLSQQETLRLQRMRAAVGEVMSNPTLSQDEKDTLALHLKTGIDPLAQRQKQAQAQMMQAHAEMFHQQAAQAKSVETQNADFEKKLLESGVGVLKWADPHTGKIHPLIQNSRTGEWYNPLLSSAKSAAAEGVKTAGGLSEENYLKHRLEVIKSVDQWIAQREKPVKGADGKESVPHQFTPEERKQLYDDALKQADMGASWEQHLKRRGRMKDPGEPDVGGGGFGGGSGAPQPKLDEAESFDEKPWSQWTDVQRDMVGKYETILADVQRRADLPPEVRGKATFAAQAMSGFVQAFGSVARMRKESPETYKQFQMYRDFLDELPAPPAPPPAPPPPPPPVGTNEAIPRLRVPGKLF